VVLFTALLVALSHQAPAGGPTVVGVDDQTVRVTIADSDELRSRGLGGRAGLAPDEGMLFVFDTDLQPGFWMKDMLFSIDILWLDSEKRIVHIAPRVAPDTYPKAFFPPVPSRYVLELPTGFAARHKIRIGDVARW
jgi:uncharacterized membrane protein (UPF0127 family)